MADPGLQRFHWLSVALCMLSAPAWAQAADGQLCPDAERFRHREAQIVRALKNGDITQQEAARLREERNQSQGRRESLKPDSLQVLPTVVEPQVSIPAVRLPEADVRPTKNGHERRQPHSLRRS